MDSTDSTLGEANANIELKRRYEINKESNIVEMAGPLFCDLFFYTKTVT